MNRFDLLDLSPFDLEGNWGGTRPGAVRAFVPFPPTSGNLRRTADVKWFPAIETVHQTVDDQIDPFLLVQVR